MSEKEEKGKTDRKKPRIYFEPGKRPLLEIGKNKFEVEDISEVGLKFLVDSEISLTREIVGTVSFFKGDTVEIAGKLQWTRGNSVGV